MHQRSPRRAVTCALISVLSLTVFLPACGGTSNAKGFTVKAPVLWAGTGTNGQIESGIENATVTASTDGASGFAVDLASVKAKNAGPQWLAASASAAAVASLLNATDPATINLSYTITGQIDGPSGGALLTIASLAALRELKLAKDITMTGTVSPDGSVGRVGEIPAKLRGAAKAGYKRVLLPTSNLVASGEPSTSDMIEFGRSLGLEVKGVEDIATAFREFTGQTIYNDAPPAPAPSVTSDALSRDQASRLLDRIAASITPSTSASIITEFDQARAALAAGESAKAYGLGVDVYTLVKREDATTAIDALVASQGGQAANADLKRQATELEALSSKSLQANSKLEGLDAVAQLSLPFALSWITWADAILEGTISALKSGAITPNSYGITAAAIAEQRAAIEVFGPDAIEFVSKNQNPKVTTSVPPALFLSNYTNFLAQAGAANRDYITAVVGSKSTTDASGSPVFVSLGLDALAATVAATPTDLQPLDEEIQQSAVALTYFVFGTGLVSATGSSGIIGNGVGADIRSTISIPGLITAVVLADSNVRAQVDLLAARNIDPAYPRWSTSWGIAAANALNGSGRDAAGEYLALNEAWYDVINCSVLYAATSPS